MAIETKSRRLAPRGWKPAPRLFSPLKETLRAAAGPSGRLPRLAAALVVSAALLPGCGKEMEDAGDAPDPQSRSGSAAPAAVWFEEVAAERGLDFRHIAGQDGQKWLPQIMGGGAALVDADGDGDLDAYLVQSGRLTAPASEQPPNRLYGNRGDGYFEAPPESGAEAPGYGMGVAAGDVDNDSDVDLYVTNLGENALLRNRGRGRFEDATEGSGLGDPGWGASAAFFDYDRDGDLDLVLVNYLRWRADSEIDCVNTLGLPEFCGPQSYAAPTPDRLYRNDGGAFADVSAAAGFEAVAGNGLGVACADFDGDGLQDVFVANDQTMDRLWLNRGGRFEESAMMAGCAVDEDGKPKAGMGIAVGDVDDDGDPDLAVCNMHDETDSYFLNEGSYFRDVTAGRGLAASRRFTRFGMGWLDFDNDGYLDLYEANGKVEVRERRYADDPYAEPNLLFKGEPGGFFQEALPRGGTAEPLVFTSRAAAFGDVDGDGGVDILVANCDGPAHLLRNVASPRGRWISFRVVLENGRDALGATVSLGAGERRLVRDVRAAYSYLASSDPKVHFGLGEETRVFDVTVRWPDGSSERFGEFDAGSVVELRRGAGAK